MPLPPRLAAGGALGLRRMRYRPARWLSALTTNIGSSHSARPKSTKRTSPRIACPARFYIPNFLVCTRERLDAGTPYRPRMFQPARWLLVCVRISSAQRRWCGDHQQHQYGVQKLDTIDADAPENFGTRAAPWAT